MVALHGLLHVRLGIGLAAQEVHERQEQGALLDTGLDAQDEFLAPGPGTALPDAQAPALTPDVLDARRRRRISSTIASAASRGAAKPPVGVLMSGSTSLRDVRKPAARAGYRACCSQREKTGGSSNISRWAS